MRAVSLIGLWAVLLQDKAPDPKAHLYEFPFPAGKTIRVLAGNGEGSTHQGDFLYCWDFLIPVGDIVCATRSGTVSQVFDARSERRGMGVLINHGDGTHALYGHLLRGGVLVKIGEKVFAGEPIAKVGPESGCDTPHLHYHVTTDERLRTKNSAPVSTNFKGPDGRAWIPHAGDSCTSSNAEPAGLSDIRRARRARPLLEAALALKAYDVAMEISRALAGIDTKNPNVEEILKGLPEKEKIEKLDGDLLATIAGQPPGRALALATFAMNECRNSPRYKEFEAKAAELKEKVSAEEQKQIRATAEARKALIQGLKSDLRDSWTQAREQYEKAAKSSDGTVQQLAKPLLSAVTIHVR
jgi:hypothetical protein